MALAPLMVYRQLVLISLLLVLFWVLYARLYRQESFLWWGLAGTSFVAYLAITAVLLHLGPEWTLLKSALVLFSVFARFLQVPLLVFAACSMRLVEPRWRPWVKPGIGVTLLAGALSFALSFMYRNQPVTSVSLRSLPQAVGLTAALVFYAFSFLERWRRDRSSPATVLVGGFCVLYAWDQVLYVVGYIRGLILGANAVVSPPGLPVLEHLGLIVDPGVLRRAFDLPLLVHPSVVFLEGLSSCGICLGMAMLVMEGHYRAKSDLKEIALRSRYLAENNAALLTEIKERKRLEQALKETEDLYRDLVEHSEDLVCTHDMKGRLLFVNPTSAHVLGYQVDELLRMTLRDLLAPRYRDRFDIYMSRIQKKGAARGLMTVLSRTGEERIWEYNNVLRTEGVPYPIVRGMAHDVTEKALAESDLRRSEAKFATAFRSNPSAMIISTLADGKCIDVNDAFQRQTGYGRDEVIGRNVRQFEIWVDATEWDSVVVELQNGAAVKNHETRLRTKSKDSLTVSYSADIIELAGESCVLAVGEDITARKEVEEKLRDLSSHLVRAQEEERARIARELHDDVNQRLAVLSMQLHELKNISLNSRSSRIEKIDALSKLTSEISTDVRKVSHRLHPSLLDFLGLTAAISEFCKEFGRLNEMEIEFVHHQVPPLLPKEVTLCFYRVAQEAVRNAQKHSGSRKVRVELIGAPDSVRLRVSDSGTGFDPGSVQRDRLGLISMAERLRNLGGELTVQSRPGYGTSVEASVLLAVVPSRERNASKQAGV